MIFFYKKTVVLNSNFPETQMLAKEASENTHAWLKVFASDGWSEAQVWNDCSLACWTLVGPGLSLPSKLARVKEVSSFVGYEMYGVLHQD